jgi:hypothetical protein
MDVHGESNHSHGAETFNPWSIVLGEAGDPGPPAADLLRALGIQPAAEGNRQASEQTRNDLAAIRTAFEALTADDD